MVRPFFWKLLVFVITIAVPIYVFGQLAAEMPSTNYVTLQGKQLYCVKPSNLQTWFCDEKGTNASQRFKQIAQ